MITIKVTQDNINKGIRENETSCPIALSLKSSQKKSIFINNGNLIYISGEYYTGIDSKEIRRISRFIGRFDSGYKVKPTTFRIIKGEYSS